MPPLILVEPPFGVRGCCSWKSWHAGEPNKPQLLDTRFGQVELTEPPILHREVSLVDFPPPQSWGNLLKPILIVTSHWQDHSPESDTVLLPWPPPLLHEAIHPAE